MRNKEKVAASNKHKAIGKFIFTIAKLIVDCWCISIFDQLKRDLNSILQYIFEPLKQNNVLCQRKKFSLVWTQILISGISSIFVKWINKKLGIKRF